MRRRTDAQSDGDGGTDTLVDIKNITRSCFNDVLIGGTGANVLTGGDGNDRLNGGGGADRLVGGQSETEHSVTSSSGLRSQVVLRSDMSTLLFAGGVTYEPLNIQN
jgi:Ca2+-binding RTX toxin-like protein